MALTCIWTCKHLCWKLQSIYRAHLHCISEMKHFAHQLFCCKKTNYSTARMVIGHLDSWEEDCLNIKVDGQAIFLYREIVESSWAGLHSKTKGGQGSVLASVDRRRMNLAVRRWESLVDSRGDVRPHNGYSLWEKVCNANKHKKNVTTQYNRLYISNIQNQVKLLFEILKLFHFTSNANVLCQWENWSSCMQSASRENLRNQ